MHEKQQVSEMAADVLAGQASTRAEETGESIDVSLKTVLETEAGQQLGELRDGAHRNEKSAHWQEDLAKKREQEQAREHNRVRKEEAEHAVWEQFKQSEQRELELRKDGQLARLLGEHLPEEPPAALRRLASEDRKQAEEGLVALMSNGKLYYKCIDELSEADMPARIAANRLRTTWLKGRRDGGFVIKEDTL
jgi:hypothetical protein